MFTLSFSMRLLGSFALLAVAVYLLGPVAAVVLTLAIVFYATCRMATKPRAPWMHGFLPVVVLALLAGSAMAFAQTTVTSSAPSETTINVGQLLAPWLQYLIAAAVAFILALFSWITAVINKRAGLENNANVAAIEARARDALQAALTNAAGMIVMKAGSQLDGMTVDAKSPLVVAAVNDVNKWAGEAVQRFGLSPEDLARKLIEKIGVLTASNAAVTPVTPAST